MVEVLPGEVSGVVRAPASKSLTQRAVLLAALAEGESRICGASSCGDAEAAVRAARALGADVRREGEDLRVTGGAAFPGGEIDCGESGFCLRALCAVAALAETPYLLRAEGSLRGRPLGEVEAPVRALGGSCETQWGLPPVRVCGPLRGGATEVDGAASSQFLSGLLLALPRAPGESRLIARGLKSRPYVAMTLDAIRAFGGRVDASADLTAFHLPGGQRYRAAEVEVEGDWSGAAFLLVAGAVAGGVEVEGLRPDSLQADRAVVEALRLAGASVEWREGRLRVGGGALSGFTWDASDCPDLFPALAVLACGCPGESRLGGVGRLRHKESDRGAALVEELGRMGGRLRIEGDALVVEGERLRGGDAASRGDHRIAMALAVAGLASGEGVRLADAECVAKSYPGFFRALEALRGKSGPRTADGGRPTSGG